MSFLDQDGLTWFYNRLKRIFIKTVNSIPVDNNGNVEITNVATANNLTSPNTQQEDTFIYRTSGGATSVDSGEAQLVYIEGGMKINGRIAENLNVNANNNLRTTSDVAVWRTNSDVNSTGNYIFTYTKPDSAIPTTIWSNASGTWKNALNSNINLANYGITVTNLEAPLLSIGLDAVGVSVASVVPNTFISKVGQEGSYYFSYYEQEEPEEGEELENLNEQETGWYYQNELISLEEYGLSIASGTPSAYDNLIVNYQKAGTPNSQLTISYTAPSQGTISIATPSKFSASKLNQFDSSSMYITDADISSNAIASGSNILCYCRGIGNVRNGYVAYSSSGSIIDIGWTSVMPSIGTPIMLSTLENTSELATITFSSNGYIAVLVSDKNDLCIHPKWSGQVDTIYAPYESASEIALPTVDTDGNSIPLGNYGMPAIDGVADRLTLDADGGTYTQKIGRLVYDATNLSYVQSLNVNYEYDNNLIYYVLPSKLTYNVTANPSYFVTDYGTEEFIGTSVPVTALISYNENLRDKLRTNTVTISSLGNKVTYKEIGLASNQVRHIYSGSEEPDATLLEDGDIYLKFAAASSSS